MFTVQSPGARTLVQDRGRGGYEHLGVPTSGAVDIGHLALANRLLDNPDDAAALEIVASGPSLTFGIDTAVAYVGAPADMTLDGRPVPNQQTVWVRAGQTLTIATLRETTYGYLAVRGGINVSPVLGSRSSCTLSGLGPRALRSGEVLPLGASLGPVPHRAVRAARRPPSVEVRYLPGPHAHLFAANSLDAFRGTQWTVSPNTSRVGVRLDGTPIEVPDCSLGSLGMVTGAIQVPPNGLPVMLGPDHGTTGGYPVIATVVPGDIPSLLQRSPGTPVRFVALTEQEAIRDEEQRCARLTAGLVHLDRVCG